MSETAALLEFREQGERVDEASQEDLETTLPNPPLQRTWSSLTLGLMQLNGQDVGLTRSEWQQ
jgi:hypothetical protein